MLPPAIPVPLPFWRDPRSPLALTLTLVDATGEVFFTLWDAANDEPLPQLGKITFAGCWASNSLRTEHLPHGIDRATLTSYLLEVPKSAWLGAVVGRHAPGPFHWHHPDPRQSRHYVVVGTDSYLEVLAASYTAGMASPEENQRYAFLRE